MKSNTGLSNLALMNVEALAQNETGRDDCEPALDICSQIVIYPGGNWGLDILMAHKKAPGWL